eukprot:scaffold415316_cov19-Prasinocladus_malaysianus.AAC.1
MITCAQTRQTSRKSIERPRADKAGNRQRSGGVIGCRIALGWLGWDWSDWIGMNRIELDWTGRDWTGLDGVGLN